MSAKGVKSTQNSKKHPAIIQRNVLASPFDKFWPLIDAVDSETLTKLLERLLPMAVIPKGYLTSKKLRQIYREKDKSKRKEMWKLKSKVVNASEVEVAKQNRKYLLMGVNAVTRGIENSKVAGCLISSDVSPRLIVSHVITMAARSKVPVLVVPSLKQITRTSLGVPCLVFGLHMSVAEEKDNNFYTLYETIVNLNKKIVIPEHLQSADVSDNEEISNNQNICKTSESSLPVNATVIKSVDESGTTTNEISKDSTFTYLYRTNTDRRVYVPPKVDIKLESSHLTFIPIGGHKEVLGTQSRGFRRRNKRPVDENSEEEDDDDDDDDDILDDENENLFELLPDSDSLFCIDTKGTDKNIKDDSVKKTYSSSVQLKPTIIKKIKSNPNKKRRKMSNKR